MANDTAQPGKPTVVYSPLRLNWKNVVAGSVIALLIVAIGVFAFSYYNPDATTVPPVVIKSGTQSAKTSKATTSAEKVVTADWKSYTNTSVGYLLKYPEDYNLVTKDLLPKSTIEIRSGNYKEKITDGTRTIEKGSSISVKLAFPSEGFVGDVNAYKTSNGWHKEENQKNLRVVEVSGYDAQRFYYEPKDSLKYDIVTLETKGKIYEFWFEVASSDSSTQTKIFDQILSTFKFLD